MEPGIHGLDVGGVGSNTSFHGSYFPFIGSDSGCDQVEAVLDNDHAALEAVDAVGVGAD